MCISNLFQHYQQSLTDWHCSQAHPLQFSAELHDYALDSVVAVDKFSDMLLMRIESRGEQAYQSEMRNFANHLGLYILLDGCDQLAFSSQNLTTQAGEVWAVQGEFERLSKITQPQRGRAQMLHLEFSAQRIEEWQALGILPHQRSAQAMRLLTRHQPAVLIKARQLLQQARNANGIERLKVESLMLDLTAQIFQFSLAAPVQPSRIDEVLHILHHEFHQNLSIAQLARRVGLNECYLKRDFKAQTGETILSYLRRLRLEHAFELLANQQKSLKETMYYVGYRHAGHFNALFKQRFGCLPSEV